MTDAPFTETHRETKREKPQQRCAGCGHRQFQHRRYMHGTNRHGSRWVCTVDNCPWTECRGLPEQEPAK
jgi:hypothetical protein